MVTGIFEVMYNKRVQMPTSDGLPVELTQGAKVPEVQFLTKHRGIDNKWSIVNSEKTLYFADSRNRDLCALNIPPALIDELTGMKAFFDNNSWFTGKYSLLNREPIMSSLDLINDDVLFGNKNFSLS